MPCGDEYKPVVLRLLLLDERADAGIHRQSGAHHGRVIGGVDRCRRGGGGGVFLFTLSKILQDDPPADPAAINAANRARTSSLADSGLAVESAAAAASSAPLDTDSDDMAGGLLLSISKVVVA